MKAGTLISLPVVFLVAAFLLVSAMQAIPKSGVQVDMPQIVVPAPQQAKMAVANAVSKPAPVQLAFGETLGPTLDGNTWLSTRHPEAEGIVSGLHTIAGHSGMLRSRGDCKSVGSICIFVGLDNKQAQMKANYAALWIAGKKQVAFVVVQTLATSGFQPGWTRIGNTQYYANPDSALWKCVWWLANRTQNGHRIPPENEMMTVGQSWEAWAVVQQRYNLVVPVAEMRIPSWNRRAD